MILYGTTNAKACWHIPDVVQMAIDNIRAHALQRVQIICRALAEGFTLDELSRIFKVRDAGGAPCEEVRNLAQKLSEVETRLSELTALRDDLQRSLAT